MKCNHPLIRRQWYQQRTTCHRDASVTVDGLPRCKQHAEIIQKDRRYQGGADPKIMKL